MLSEAKKGEAFESGEAAILHKAYENALIELSVDYNLDRRAKEKLAQIVLAIGKRRALAGGQLTDDKDVQHIAAIASDRLLRLSAK